MTSPPLPWMAAVLLLASPARALQPLEVFVAAARDRNPDAETARANLSVQNAQADVALGKQLPGITVNGGYTRNQFAASVALSGTRYSLQPLNEWSGSATITVPLIDLASFARIAAARTNAESYARTLEATLLAVESRTAQDYYQLLANRALVSVAEKYLEVSRQTLRITQSRLSAGTATLLEVNRAMADVEQQVQQLASARLQLALSARDLESTTSIEPDISSEVELSDDLHSEPDLPLFEAELVNVPSVNAAAAATRAAQQQADAQRFALLPTLSGNFTEYGTNAPGFQPSSWWWQAGVGFTWSFDLTSVANIRSGDASAAAAQAREFRASLDAGDTIHRYWHTVRAGIAQSRSARAGRDAAVQASDQARVQYLAGTATQLDLLQAQRDAFAAEVTRIQDDANLLNARGQLRLATGRSLGRSRKGS
jgi:outer membrane protein TolC